MIENTTLPPATRQLPPPSPRTAARAAARTEAQRVTARTAVRTDFINKMKIVVFAGVVFFGLGGIAWHPKETVCAVHLVKLSMLSTTYDYAGFDTTTKRCINLLKNH
jgi:hypothetical protein